MTPSIFHFSQRGVPMYRNNSNINKYTINIRDLLYYEYQNNRTRLNLNNIKYNPECCQ